MNRAFSFLLVVILALAAPHSVASQVPSPATSRLRVYIDCNVSGCDFDYLRSEIEFVDYMRDRQDASLHVLVTAQPTGSAGTEYVLNFIGKRELASLSDTLRFQVAQTASQDDKRKALAHSLKLGLVRYVAKTGSAQALDVKYASPAVAAGSASATPVVDRWNYWVFRTSANSNFSGEKTYRSFFFNGSQSANRITESVKVRLSFNGTYNEGKFTFSDGSRFANYGHAYGFSELVVKSVGPHWSVGQRSSASSSTFLNQKLAVHAGPAIEYDLFPYKEANRRQLTFQYSVGLSSFRYLDTTLFNKISETLPDQSLITSLGLKQPWGSVSATLTGATYLNDLSKNRLELFNSIEARLFKGLSVNVFLSTALIRDQLYLSKGTATDDEVLTRRRQLATSYRYFGGLGFSYTFGSIFNNIVNTRFDGPSGGTIFFF